jgi:hypothetical protein
VHATRCTTHKAAGQSPPGQWLHIARVHVHQTGDQPSSPPPAGSLQPDFKQKIQCHSSGHLVLWHSHFQGSTLALRQLPPGVTRASGRTIAAIGLKLTWLQLQLTSLAAVTATAFKAAARNLPAEPGPGVPRPQPRTRSPCRRRRRRRHRRRRRRQSIGAIKICSTEGIPSCTTSGSKAASTTAPPPTTA